MKLKKSKVKTLPGVLGAGSDAATPTSLHAGPVIVVKNKNSENE